MGIVTVTVFGLFAVSGLWLGHYRPASCRDMDFRLRPAQPSDREFIWRLRAATMRDMIEAAYGWDETTQRAYADESLGGMIVLVGDEPVGVLTLADWGDELHVVWMAIQSEAQGRGLGRALIEHCQREALQAGKSLTLQVLQGNPAVALYKRCGFEVYERNGPHKLLMRWRPDSSKDVGGSPSRRPWT
jgi:ribosomal protein S18 acetylase RimI-like enzyme